MAKIIPAIPTHNSELKGNYYHSGSHHYEQYCENCMHELVAQWQSKDKCNYKIKLQKKTKKYHYSSSQRTNL